MTRYFIEVSKSVFDRDVLPALAELTGPGVPVQIEQAAATGGDVIVRLDDTSTVMLSRRAEDGKDR